MNRRTWLASIAGIFATKKIVPSNASPVGILVPSAAVITSGIIHADKISAGPLTVSGTETLWLQSEKARKAIQASAYMPVEIVNPGNITTDLP